MRPAGKTRLTTPAIDRMAAEGVRLTHHYSGSPICVSSRATLFTGRNQGHCTVRDANFDMPWPAAQPSLGACMRQAGYHTALIGKYGLCGAAITSPYNTVGHPLYRGFDYFLGYLRHSDQPNHYPGNTGKIVENFGAFTNSLQGVFNDDLFLGKAKHYIQERTQTAPGQPFFLMLNLTAPHYDLQYPPLPYPAGSGVAGGMTWPPPSGAVDGFIHPDILAATYDHDDNPATAQVPWPEAARRFAALVRRFDESIDDLLQTLRDLNLASNTVVVLTSDHGPDFNYSFSNSYKCDPRHFDSWGPFDGAKHWLLEGGIRVPAIVWGPGRIRSGAVEGLPSTWADWLPTLVDFAGLPTLANTDGRTLRPLLTGAGSQRPTDFLCFEYSRPPAGYYDPVEVGIMQRKGLQSAAGLSQMVRIGDHTGIRFNTTGETTPLRLYNVADDPAQTQDLAALPQHAGLLAEMRRLMLAARIPSTVPAFARTIDGANLPALGIGVNPGLHVRAFEGAWPWLPDFRDLAPASTGVVATLDLSARTRDDQIGLEFTGYLHVPQAGVFDFHLTADTGAALWIDESNPIAEDLASFGTRRGTLRLNPGAHAFRLAWRHDAGPRVLRLEWEGPGVLRRDVGSQDFHRGFVVPSAPIAMDDFFEIPSDTANYLDPLANDLATSVATLRPPVTGWPPGFSQAGSRLLYNPASSFLGELRMPYTLVGITGNSSAMIQVSVYRPTPDLWLPFSGFSGAITRDANGRLAGQLVNFASMPTPVVEGRFDTALVFDGADDKVVVNGFAPPDKARARTVAAWVKAQSNGPVVTWGASSTGWKWFLELEAPTGQPALGVLRAAAGSGWVKGSRNLLDGHWHHIACTFSPDETPDITDTRMFVDGVLEPAASAQAVTVNTAASDVWIGGDIHGRFFRGIIDEVRVLPVALSDLEIAGMADPGGGGHTASFARRYFGADPVDWLDDPDQDGLSNLLEYAYGGQPWVADGAGIRPRGWEAQGVYRFQARRRVNGGLSYRLESSTNLTTWALAEGTFQVSPDSLPSMEVLEYTVPEAGNPMYLRLRVDSP